MSDISVKLDNISKFYKLYNSPKDRLKEALHPFKKKLHKKFYALQNINLEIKRGEILGIVGKNGSGKSTLLKLICEIIQPSSGKLIVNGAVSALLDLSVGLNPEFTGMQNIYFSGTMMGFSRKEMEKKIDGIVDFADIGDFIHQPLKTYSSGMKARLGFALAINMEPEILVLDEVLAVGDELFRRKCYAKMEEFLKSDCTILFVSHSVGAVNEICRRAILLDQGEQILEGPTKFVTMHYQKFLYARARDINKVRNEIIQLNKEERNKRNFVDNVNVRENVKKEESIKTEINETIVKKQGPKQEAFYMPHLISKSKVVQKNEDIDVYDICIETLEGKKVNCLVVNEEYFLTYRVKFNVDVGDFAVGWLLKNEKGLHLSGSRYPGEKRNIKNAKKNEIYLIKWKFKCSLLNGIYYIDIGIISFLNEMKNMLAAYLDALTFKVQRPEYKVKRVFNWAIFNMGQELETVELLHSGDT
jgi:lipopolysaccharide transport system ATP-binding protein